jgi:hypothetical protein
MATQSDLNKFNLFIDSATQAITCGSECQKEKATQQLKDKYLNAQSNLVLAEPQYQTAKQNYYTSVSGQNGYNEMLEKELNEKADIIVDNFKESFSSELNKTNVQLDSYNSLLINYRNVVELFKQYLTDNNKLKKQLKDDSNDVLTNERKTFYEDQQIDSLNKYYHYIILVIYIISVVCFVIFSLIYPTQTSLKVRLLLTVMFIILPFISSWLLGYIVYILYWLFGLLPKNVYK